MKCDGLFFEQIESIIGEIWARRLLFTFWGRIFHSVDLLIQLLEHLLPSFVWLRAWPFQLNFAHFFEPSPSLFLPLVHYRQHHFDLNRLEVYKPAKLSIVMPEDASAAISEVTTFRRIGCWSFLSHSKSSNDSSPFQLARSFFPAPSSGVPRVFPNSCFWKKNNNWSICSWTVEIVDKADWICYLHSECIVIHIFSWTRKVLCVFDIGQMIPINPTMRLILGQPIALGRVLHFD